MHIRKWCFAIGALALLLLSAASGAQEADDDAKKITERTYDVGYMIDDRPAEWHGSVWPELHLYGRVKDEDYDDIFEWPFAHQQGPYSFEKIDELKELFEALAQDGELESVAPAEFWPSRLVVKATEALHTRIAKAVDMLTQMLRARLRIEVRRLAALPESLVVKAPAGGTLIGSQEICQGGFALFSDIRKTRITWSSSQSDRGTLPQTDDNYSGRQLGVSALLLHDGRVRMQAWHCGLSDDGVRERQTRCGLIQFPSATWDATPGSAIVANGGGLVLDAPGGPYLITVRTDAAIPHAVFDEGVTLWNAAGAIHAGSMTGAWHLGEVWSPDYDSDAPLFLPPGADDRDVGPPPYEAAPALTAAAEMAESYEMLADQAALEIAFAGPLFYSRERKLERGEDPIMVKVARVDVAKLMIEQVAGPDTQAVSIRILRVPKAAVLPAGIVAGKPTAADIASLDKLAGVSTAFERHVLVAVGQLADVTSLKLENYLASMHGWGYDDEPRWFDTTIATHSSGTQVRVKAEASGRLTVVAGWRLNSKLREVKGDGALEGETLEMPEWDEVRFQLGDIVADGGALSGVQPLDDQSVCVLLVARREVK